MNLDPLSDIFSLNALASVRCTRLEADGSWALWFPQRERLKFVAILRGAAWIVIPDRPPLRLEAGDTLLLTNTPFTIASDPAVPAKDGLTLFEASKTNTVRLAGNKTVMLGGAFVFADDNARLLIEALPAFMYIPAQQPTAVALSNILSMLDRELEHPGMGSSVMSQRLADILLIQALRGYVAQYGQNSAGWIGAFSDARVGRAIALMHGDVAHRWTVGELAAAVAMSRSGFALRFKSMVGLAPLEYLRRWRMQLARRSLRSTSCSIGDTAAALGYSSESAFGNAYKREFGQSPTQHSLGALNATR